MSNVRRIDASEYSYDDPRRYIWVKDWLSEPENQGIPAKAIQWLDFFLKKIDVRRFL